MSSPTIHRITELDLRLERRPWPFADERRAEIEAYFARLQQHKPQLWNGRILMARDRVFDGSRYRASYFETDFASFLAWRDWGHPDRAVFNCFGMGALRCADGTFVLGEMGDHTANAGRIYFPSGTPDLADLRGTTVDIGGSVVREVEEETGLTLKDYRVADHWDCVVAGTSVAMMRTLHAVLSGEALRAKIEAHLAGESSPELVGIHLVRDLGDLRPTMPVFVTAFLEQQLGSSPT
jgi:8-oxo-dGTP pyrophosphatase MutT (NUDIX family)